MRNTNRCAKPSTRTQQWKQAIATTVLILACGSYGQAQAASAKTTDSTRYTFDIPSLKVEQALSQLAKQTGHQLLFSYAVVGSHKSTAVSGDHSLTSALQQLLQTTPLTGHLTERGVIVVTDTSARNHMDKGRGNMNITTKKGLLAGLVGVFAATGGVGSAMAQGGEAATGQSAIDEIIVTANKREQSLQETAMSITALGEEEIRRKDHVSMQDYLRTISGVSFTERGAGRNEIIIRGMTTSGGGTFPTSSSNSTTTVGTYFGETPLLSGSADIKLVDMERIEVLRGPQGSLYGASSMGGTVRNIPKSPNLKNLQGEVSGGYSHTGEKGGGNTNIKGIINIPIIENRLAIRASGYRFKNSGYFQNIAASDPAFSANAAFYGVSELAVDEDNVGNDEYVGGRFSALWTPVDNLRISFSYLTQDIEQSGFPESLLGQGAFQQTRLQLGEFVEEGKEFLAQNTEIINAVIEYDLGWASILSSSSWNEEHIKETRDIGSFFGGAPFPQLRANREEDFVQEVRLTSQLDGKFHFIAGTYYQNTDIRFDFTTDYAGAPTLNPFGSNQVIQRGFWETNVEQLAFFGELVYDIFDQLSITLGARHFSYDKNRLEQNLGGVFTPVAPAVTAEGDESGQTYKANLAYSANEDTLIYAQWSEGFRLGRAIGALNIPACDADNNGILDGTNVSAGSRLLESDSLQSYEIGSKLTLLDGRINLNAAMYKNNWSDIPVRFVLACGFGIDINAGKARTRGFEIESKYYFSDALHLDVSTSYIDAELSEMSSLGNKGDRLPGAPKYNAQAGVQYDFDFGGHDSFFRADYAYVGGYYNNVKETGIEAGDYQEVSIRAGILINELSIDLSVRNLTNENNISWVGTVFPDGRINRLRPRTIGMNFGYRF